MLNPSLLWNEVYCKIRYQKYKHYIGSSLGRYKREDFFSFLNKWVDSPVSLAVKTDSFEEAFGSDKIMGELARISQKVVGLDASRLILNEAKKYISGEKFKWTVADISHMPFDNSVFDLIFSSATYGYLNNVAKGLKEAHRILKPHGSLIISVMNQYNFSLLVERKFFHCLGMIPFPLSKVYTVKKFKALLREAGFCIEAEEPLMCIYPFFDCVIHLLEKNDSSISRIISKMIMDNMKKVRKLNKVIRYLTAWFVVFKAKKF